MIVVAALVCASCTSGANRASPPASAPVPTTLPMPTSTTEPPPHYAPSPYSWDRSSAAALAVGGGAGTTISAIIAPAVAQPWVAFGTRISAGGVPTATEWTSPNGTTWTASAIATGGTPSSALAATEYRGETVVVGSLGSGANQQAAAWVSRSPGAPFSPVQVPISAGPSSMSLVAAGALGIFATGTVDGRFAVWSTADGRNWGEQPSAERTISSVPGTRVWTLMAEGDVIYAAGSADNGPASAAAVWATNDGLHWHRIGTATSSFSGPGDRVIYSLAPLGTGLVAVGALNRGHGWVPASWVSPDGASWSPPSTDFPGNPATAPAATGSAPADVGSAARSVAAIPTFDGSAAVVAAGGGPAGQAEWKSADGLHWSPIQLPAPTRTATGWRATITAATIDTTIVADGEPGEGRMLVDTPGGWAQPSVNPTVFGPVRPRAEPVSLQFSGGLLLLTVSLTTAPQSIGAATSTTTTLVSPDGVHWTAGPTGTGSPASLPATGAVTVRTPDGWYAVADGSSGRIEGWTSPDGHTWTSSGLLPTSTPPAGTASSPAAVAALCAAASTPAVAAVGQTPQATTPGSPAATVGRAAAAWVSDGSSWKRAPVSPGPAAGTREMMDGCAPTGSGLVAWGASGGAGGVSVPAIWRSGTGASWSRASVGAFSPGSIGPITSLALNGSDWVAAADPRTAPGPSATLDNGQAALWVSPDGGSTWQVVDTFTPPWLGSDSSAVTLVAYAGRTPVLAGSVDDQLAVWTGTPMTKGDISGSSTTGSG